MNTKTIRRGKGLPMDQQHEQRLEDNEGEIEDNDKKKKRKKRRKRLKVKIVDVLEDPAEVEEARRQKIILANKERLRSVLQRRTPYMKGFLTSLPDPDGVEEIFQLMETMIFCWKHLLTGGMEHSGTKVEHGE